MYLTAIKDKIKVYQSALSEVKGALASNIAPDEIINCLIAVMENVGQRFDARQIYLPHVLLSGKYVLESVNYIESVCPVKQKKGTLILGTVFGDLHEIGKNIVKIMFSGAGIEVVDLGYNVKSDVFIEAVRKSPGAVVGLSCLLTTTMSAMEKTVKALKAEFPDTSVIVGGAPITREFCKQIGADYYSPLPQEAIDYVKALIQRRGN